MVHEKSSPDAASGGCLVVIAIIGALVLVRSCAGSQSTTNTSATSDTVTSETTVADTITPAAKAPVSPQVIRRAARHAELAVGALGGEGAATYSRACRQTLERQFSLAVFDRCYAFELFVARMLEVGDGYASEFSESSIQSRWSDAFLSAAGQDSALNERRQDIESAATGVAVSPQQPPTAAASSELPIDEEATEPSESQSGASNDAASINSIDELAPLPQQ